MANPNLKSVTDISTAKQTISELLAEAAAKKAQAQRMIDEANQFEQAHAEEFAAAKTELRETAVKAVAAYKAVATPEEMKVFRAAIGIGVRKGGKRHSVPCSVCGKTRHGKNNPCSGNKRSL